MRAESEREFLCMGYSIGESHHWGMWIMRFDHTGLRVPATQMLDCPEHDGAERSVTTEPLHVHECYGCSGVFTHAESGCGADRPLAQRFVCWMCSREGR